MLFFRKTKRRGSILSSILGFLGLAALVSLLTQINLTRNLFTAKSVQKSRYSTLLSSSIETFLVAYRHAEKRYIQAMSVCETARPFLEALKSGSGCVGPLDKPEVTVFVSSPDDPGEGELYSYVTPAAPITPGCQITESSSTCASQQKELLSIGETRDEQMINKSKMHYYLVTIDPARGNLELSVEIRSPLQQRPTRHSFSIRTAMPNAAHLEAGGHVTQENPDPLARCAGTPWADYRVFNSANRSCNPFVELGSGTGLAFHEGRFFGLRPFDGSIIDMYNATFGNSYMVGENGKIDGRPVFPKYKKETLINVDDITTIADQIYYVAQGGVSAQIGVLNPLDPSERVRVCDLGGAGWAQSYSGIAATSWSEPLFPVAGDGLPTDDRMAYFFLKSDTGNLLTVVAVLKSWTAPDKPVFECFVTKDQNLQKAEYKRTLGFDRTALAKPYFIF